MLVERARAFLVLALSALLLSCGGGGGGAGVTGSLAAPLPAPVPVPAPVTLALRQVATGLDNPVFLTAPAADARLFIVERAGRIRILQNGLVSSLPFLDISGRVSTAGEGGLLSMAFHPQYATNGQYFIYFTDTAGDIVVERRSVSPNPSQSDPTSALEIIRIAHPGFTNHYGGLVAFGPDGYLYLGTGDGGSAGDPPRNAQNLGSLLGKMLRLDINGATAGAPYAVPATNPFANERARRGEIWAYGLRNPWRYAFDAARLYIADVGQDRREEVDIAAASQGALNYGWNIMEGTLCYSAASCDSTGLTAPAFEYDHGAADANGCSITGGYVYRGQALPELAGRYFYSDYCAGFLKSFLAAGAGALEQIDWRIPDIGRVVSFGRDADGELYLVTDGGTIHKIIRGGVAGG
ncbi:MAG: glucose dehydrogenase [Massilia sp.]|nr:glucose dehydrogenase [Massilia sp.]